MGFKDYYDDLLAALDAVYAGEPVGSHELLAWLEAHRPEVVARLKAEGYPDPEDEARTGWSWRQYLGNALSRLKQNGSVELVGHSEHTPEGYYGPVGLWRPAGVVREPATFRLPEQQVAALKELSRGLGMSTRAVVERLLAPALALPSTQGPSHWLDWLEAQLPLALADAGLSLPIRDQSLVMRVSWSLALRLADALEDSGSGWHACAQRATHDRRCGPAALRARIVKDWQYEEGSDLALYTERRGRWWPLVAMESEAYKSHGTKLGAGDYEWDFYKLFGRMAAGRLMVARVGGAGGASTQERMEELTETFDVTWRRYQHLLGVGQPMLVVLLAATGEARFMLGAGVAPGLMSWRR